jgi:hypothetical protein
LRGCSSANGEKGKAKTLRDRPVDYPLHGKTIVVTRCGRICLGKKKINFGQAFAGQAVGIKEVHDDIWLVSFRDYDDWAEVLLYIVGEDIHVVPREQMPHYTSLSLDSSRIWDYRNAWCVLDGVDPTSSFQMKVYRQQMK